MYKVEDDVGVMVEGSKEECRGVVKDWLQSDEASCIYSEMELEEGMRYFDRDEAVSFMGFHISRIEVK